MESSGRTAPTTAHPSSGTGCAVVVVAAGSGQRLGRGIPKALVELAGRAILEHSLRAVLDSGVCAEGGRIVVTVPAGDEQLSAVCRELGAQPVTGAQTRAASVRASTSSRCSVVNDSDFDWCGEGGRSRVAGVEGQVRWHLGSCSNSECVAG